MKSKSLLFLLGAAVALSVGTVAHAGDRDHRDSRRDDHRRQNDHHDNRGRHDDHDRGRRWDSHGHSVWSRDFPRAHFYVGHRPPPMRFEHRSFRPSSRHYWIPGCWRWRPGYADWIWVNGYWDLPPYEHYVYVGPRYVEDGGRVVYVEGGWSEPAYAHDGEATGTVIGAVAGGIIGHQSHNTGAGVVVGAVVGNAIGREADKEDAERRALAQQSAPLPVASNSLPEASALQAEQPPVDPELAAAQERARVAKAKLAEAKAARETAEAKAQALKKANAEADAAEAELKAISP